MIQVIRPGMRTGTVHVPASKSTAHRLLIAAALSKTPCRVFCRGVSKDIEATARCLNALGAKIEYAEDPGVFTVRPVRSKICPPKTCDLYCGESGTTLRFLLPLAAALGRKAVFHMEGLLSKRPMGPLTEALMQHGVRVFAQDELLFSEGQLQPGEYRMPGNISSQFISGLLLSLPLLNADSRLVITENIESEGYIDMTEQVLLQAGVRFEKDAACYRIFGDQDYSLPAETKVESDWSGAAAFLCMGALSKEGISIPGMNLQSCHADTAILNVLKDFGADIQVRDGLLSVKKCQCRPFTVDASNAPDLVPVVSALACAADGESRIIHAERLRLKESDRLKTTSAMLNALGAKVTETADGLVIRGTGTLSGGMIDPANDHRIAMAAAVAASVCKDPVTIRNSECVGKSYPKFYEDLEKLDLQSFPG